MLIEACVGSGAEGAGVTVYLMGGVFVFETCGSLEELNKERQRLMRSGGNPMEVNAAYNRAKRCLLEEVPTYRKIPTYTGTAGSVGVFTPFPMLSGTGRPNEIIITPEGVLL